jgi:superkiller protein 3
MGVPAGGNGPPRPSTNTKKSVFPWLMPSRLSTKIMKKDANDLHEEGKKLSDKGKFTAAIKKIAAAIDLDPAFVDAYCTMGFIYGELGDFAEAERWYRNALVHDPDHYQTLYNLAYDLEESSRADEAIEILRHLTATYIDADSYKNLGYTFKNLGRLDEAINAYRDALALQPNDTNTLYCIANILDDLRRYDEAENECLAALKIDPFDASAYNCLGDIYLHMELKGRAAKAYKKATDLDNDPMYYRDCADVLIQQRKPKAALKHIRIALRKEPSDARAYRILGDIYEYKRDTIKAKEAYRNALKIDPTLDYAWGGLANVYARLGKKPKALDYLARLSTNSSQDPQAILFDYGLSLIEADKLNKAINVYRDLSVAQPDNTDVWRQLGISYEMYEKYDKALAAYTTGLQLDPNHRNLHNDIGVLYEKLDKLDDARKEYEAALSIDRFNGKAIENLKLLNKRTKRQNPRS